MPTPEEIESWGKEAIEGLVQRVTVGQNVSTLREELERVLQEADDAMERANFNDPVGRVLVRKVMAIGFWTGVSIGARKRKEASGQIL